MISVSTARRALPEKRRGGPNEHRNQSGSDPEAELFAVAQACAVPGGASQPKRHLHARRPHDTDEVLAGVLRLHLEDLVAKRVDSRYEPGKRSTAWRNLKCADWRGAPRAAATRALTRESPGTTNAGRGSSHMLVGHCVYVRPRDPSMDSPSKEGFAIRTPFVLWWRAKRSLSNTSSEAGGAAQRLRHLTITEADRYEAVRAAWPELADRIHERGRARGLGRSRRRNRPVGFSSHRWGRCSASQLALPPAVRHKPQGVLQ